MASDIILYRLKPGHSLPSCSLGCLYLEGYLAMALSQQRRREESSSRHPMLTEYYTTVDCTWETCSPSGRLPCLDWKGTLICRSDSRNRDDCDGMEEAECIIQRMHQKGILPAMHLDDALDDEHRAICEGFVCMLKQIVVPAIQSSLWLEKKCYLAFTKGLFGGGLSFPLNRVLPGVKKYYVMKSLQSGGAVSHAHCHEASSTADSNLYTAASRALERIDKYVLSMKSSAGSPETPYVFNPSPSSCDALLFACLSMIRCFPVHSALRQASKPLDRYLDALSRNIVGTSITMGAIADRTWANTRPLLPPQGQHQNADQGQQEDEQSETSIGSKGTYWLMGVGTLFAAYILFVGGQYFEIQELIDDDDDR